VAYSEKPLCISPGTYLRNLLFLKSIQERFGRAVNFPDLLMKWLMVKKINSP
jgi:hypothetical protein